MARELRPIAPHSSAERHVFRAGLQPKEPIRRCARVVAREFCRSRLGGPSSCGRVFLIFFSRGRRAVPRVNPAILVWARETAGLSLDEAAARLPIGPAKGATPAERLATIESGEVAPTRALLREMAVRYRRPLIAFYLSRAPVRGTRGEDFRMSEEPPPPGAEAILDALLRGIHSRQAILRAALEDEGEALPRQFVGSARVELGIGAVASSIRETLGFTLDEYRSAPSVDAAFSGLRARVEAVGVFALLVGDLGSHHSALGTDTFRGFALADPVAPMIVVNDRDARPAWSFTLLHELTHVWLGQTGVSGGEPVREVERFCNEVASDILLPASEVARLRLSLGQADVDAPLIADLASNYRLSRQLVAYRLFRAGIIEEPRWKQLRAAFRAEWLAQRDHDREAAASREGGPNYFIIRRHRVGGGLIRVTAQLLNAGAVTTAKAGRILGVRPSNVGPLIARQKLVDRQTALGDRR